jgi:hypothetical protein
MVMRGLHICTPKSQGVFLSDAELSWCDRAGEVLVDGDVSLILAQVESVSCIRWTGSSAER